MGNTYSHSCPLEILDHICISIDAPSDLLSVALTSKQLCSLIIPDHLHFRDLKCDLKRVSVWRMLVTRPALAMRIRTVEIIGERAHTRDPRVPSSMVIESAGDAIQNYKTDEYLDPISCLADAIRCMPRLTAFHWLDENELPDNRIYAALVETCPNLNDVEILFHDSYNAGIASCDLGNAPLWKLTNLTHFSFTEFTPECDVSTWTEYSTAMVALLQASPNLVDLQIFQYHEYHSRDLPEDIIQDLFSTATWPQLTRLSVESIFLFADEERFFKRHPKLERLCLRGPFYDDLVIAHLPCLKSLDIDWLLASADIAQDVLQSLEFLSVHITEAEDYRSFAKFCVAVKAATRLKTLLVRSILAYSPTLWPFPRT
ncbi:hypothetical protein FPV67DRAFT_1496145 [Lyophyllum atratum]|nr:hypothetical protein FPV67DRAFT_1496145 [Lyophyllum atratum]